MIFSLQDIDFVCPDDLPVGTPLWSFKHSAQQLKTLSVDSYIYNSQYQQNPSSLGGNMFKDTYWKHYDILPSDIYVIRIYGDTAQKTKESNDYSVLQVWAKSQNSGIYLIDQVRGKWEAPELESKLVDFWNKHKASQFKPLGAQVVKIEDKSSGSSLIQSIKRNYMIPVEPIQRTKDKVLRAMGVVNYFHSGYIHLPKNTTWLHDYKEEFRKFTHLMTHKHDDQIDPTMDAVEDLLVFEDMLYNNKSVNN